MHGESGRGFLYGPAVWANGEAAPLNGLRMISTVVSSLAFTRYAAG
jgi:hypothetical protein